MIHLKVMVCNLISFVKISNLAWRLLGVRIGDPTAFLKVGQEQFSPSSPGWPLGLVIQVEVAEPLSKLSLEFPDIYIGCYRKSREGPIIICLKGKNNTRIDSGVQALCKKFKKGVLVEIK